MSSFQFKNLPPADPPEPSNAKYGIQTTECPTIANAPLPAEGASSRSFDNRLLVFFLLVVPYYLKSKIGGGKWTFLFFAILTTIPILMVFWTTVSMLGSRINDKAKFPDRGVEYYLEFHDPKDAEKYRGSHKIPMETFHEMYFAGKVSFRGDALQAMEFRHDWASFRFTLSLFRYFVFGMLPEVLVHSRSQDEEQVRGHYDRGDDFYGWFLGERMVYTSGIISDIAREETLEELQDNKLRVVCEKVGLKKGDTMLDLGCGWGTLAAFASSQYGANVTGITLGRNQTAWGNKAVKAALESSPFKDEVKSEILCMDYRDTPFIKGGYKKVTCLEMAEHVGVRHFGTFLRQVYDMMDDDGLFFLQIAGLRKSWQFEDLIWGLFMNKYIFPGADASTPLGWFVDSLESAGFEIKSIDTIGVHYSATLWRWYRNWMSNKSEIVAKYGERWFRIWEYFLAYSTIISRQGGASCYQIVMHKNLNAFHRINGVPMQYGLKVPGLGGTSWIKTIKKQI